MTNLFTFLFIYLSIFHSKLTSVLGPFGVYLLKFTLPGTFMHYLASLEFTGLGFVTHITTHTSLTSHM